MKQNPKVSFKKRTPRLPAPELGKMKCVRIDSKTVIFVRPDKPEAEARNEWLLKQGLAERNRDMRGISIITP